MDLRSATNAFVNAAADVIVGGFAEAAELHEETRVQGATLRGQAAVRKLLGGKLDDVVTALAAETTRCVVARYEKCRLHPRYGKEQLVAELDDAEAALSKAIIAAQGRPSLALALALIRVEAIAIAVGDTPIAGTPKSRAATRGPAPRRRAMTAADIPDELVQPIFAIARGDDPAVVFAELRALETTPVNCGAIVTKVRLALERGAKRTRMLAETLRDAGVVEVVPTPAATEMMPNPDRRDDHASASSASIGRTSPVSRQATLSGESRKSIKDRIQPKQHGSTIQPNDRRH